MAHVDRMKHCDYPHDRNYVHVEDSHQVNQDLLTFLADPDQLGMTGDEQRSPGRIWHTIHYLVSYYSGMTLKRLVNTETEVI